MIDKDENFFDHKSMDNFETLNLVPSTQWIESIALEELNMEMSGVVHFHEHLDPTFFLEESSIHFLDQIRDRFEFYVTKFNEYRGGAQSGSQIRIFKISNTVNDFMLFRNSLRLIISRKANDLLTIGFLSGTGDVVSTRLPGEGSGSFSMAPHEIKAHVGPFNNISWRFQGEVVDIDALTKFYLTEFLRNSAR